MFSKKNYLFLFVLSLSLSNCFISLAKEEKKEGKDSVGTVIGIDLGKSIINCN